MNKNESGHYRGFHIVVYNPDLGKIETAQVFDTYKSSTGLDAFIDKGVEKGHVVAAAIMDEGSTNLSQYAKQWFADMGSEKIWDVGYRLGFSFLAVCG